MVPSERTNVEKGWVVGEFWVVVASVVGAWVVVQDGLLEILYFCKKVRILVKKWTFWGSKWNFWHFFSVIFSVRVTLKITVGIHLKNIFQHNFRPVVASVVVASVVVPAVTPELQQYLASTSSQRPSG